MHILALPFALLLLAAPAAAFAADRCATEPITAERQLDYTYTLLEEQEYFRTVGEGRRYLAFFDECGGVDTARLLVGLAYQRARQWEPAGEVFRGMADTATGPAAQMARLALADTLFRQERYEAAASSYGLFVAAAPDSPYAGYAGYRQGFAHFLDRNPEAAERAFRGVPEAAPESLHAARMAEAAPLFSALPSRSPVGAGIMSAVVPGLGQVYTGRWVDGVIAFLVNGSFVYGSYEAFRRDLPVVGILVGMFELGWYTGNIFSAVNYAHRFNERAIEGFQREWQQRELVERDWAAESRGDTRYLRFGLDF